MFCEIEFMPVGEGSKAGDAIVVRYGTPDGYDLMLVDGGHSETGETIVQHIKAHFGHTAAFRHVVLTHSDGDHACGLREVLANIPVETLWLHVPWLHAQRSYNLFADKYRGLEGLVAEIKKEYSVVVEIIDLARKQGTKINCPFQGADIGPFRVCSPNMVAYDYLMPQFQKTPAPDQAAIEAAGMWIGKESFLAKLYNSARTAAQAWTEESWNYERLRDGGITHASNESSVILYGLFASQRVLLTGDAGLSGLSWAADYAESVGLPLQQFSFVQIPHHGSRRNVGPTILNRIIGPIQTEHAGLRFNAFVSAPKDDSEHPRRIVMNAFTRRGARVSATQGVGLIHYGGFPVRQGYVTAPQLPFFDRVEQYT